MVRSIFLLRAFISFKDFRRENYDVEKIQFLGLSEVKT